MFALAGNKTACTGLRARLQPISKHNNCDDAFAQSNGIERANKDLVPDLYP